MTDLNSTVISSYNPTGIHGSTLTGVAGHTGSSAAGKTHFSASDPVAKQGDLKPELDRPSATPDMEGLASITKDSDLSVSMGSLIKLLIQLGQLGWQMNMDSRESELQSQVSSINKQAEKMHDAAIVGLVMSVVFGAINVIGGLVSIGGASKSIGKQKSLNASGGTEGKQQLLTQQAGRRNMMGESIGGVGKMGEGIGSATQQIMQADAKKEEANQAKHQADMQKANDFIQHYTSMIRELRSLFAQINQDSNQTVRSVVNKA
ncbi:type III secretion system translocon subunit SctB [Endozoicomonas sp. Mp262]|uniref:type III secretion system translocon subunit SctB n=1 Tax=Endozoicomonas sp. Mp262 TaxID=2919499 RepID=UPI0021D7EC23